MIGNLVDSLRLNFRKESSLEGNFTFLESDFGKLRVFDTQGEKPCIICVPDGPNVIEHHLKLIEKLSNHFRVICFEFPGVGFSYPGFQHSYSLERGAKITLQIMDLLKVEKAALCFSCSNGFYAIKAAEMAPERFTHLFLTQTPSLESLREWTHLNIPKIFTLPILGQILNAFTEKKLAKTWFKTALPKSTDKTKYEEISLNALRQGGCFCLSGLVQGLIPELDSLLNQVKVPSTQIWGKKDFSHRKTDRRSILKHLPNCELIVFENCGHFPELEATDEYIQLIKERLKVK